VHFGFLKAKESPATQAVAKKFRLLISEKLVVQARLSGSALEFVQLVGLRHHSWISALISPTPNAPAM
jgi:hypothetical protein